MLVYFCDHLQVGLSSCISHLQFLLLLVRQSFTVIENTSSGQLEKTYSHAVRGLPYEQTRGFKHLSITLWRFMSYLSKCYVNYISVGIAGCRVIEVSSQRLG